VLQALRSAAIDPAIKSAGWALASQGPDRRLLALPRYDRRRFRQSAESTSRRTAFASDRLSVEIPCPCDGPGLPWPGKVNAMAIFGLRSLMSVLALQFTFARGVKLAAVLELGRSAQPVRGIGFCNG